MERNKKNLINLYENQRRKRDLQSFEDSHESKIC